MRINIYAEELTGEVEFVQKDNVVGEDGNPVTFYGVRIFLLTHESMHYNEHDDDRTAITFWFREPDKVIEMAQSMEAVIPSFLFEDMGS